MMKKNAVFLAAACILFGCASSKLPYDYIENWLIREDAVRPFAVSVDLIYVQDALYVDMDELAQMQTYARNAVGRGRFHGIARVFSPLVACEDDVAKAVEWYISHHCDGTRPFIFIGEGKGGALLRSYEDKNIKMLAKKGLATSFYSEKADRKFVSGEMIREIKNVAAEERYKRQWGREMPVGMQGR